MLAAVDPAAPCEELEFSLAGGRDARPQVVAEALVAGLEPDQLAPVEEQLALALLLVGDLVEAFVG